MLTALIAVFPAVVQVGAQVIRQVLPVFVDVHDVTVQRSLFQKQFSADGTQMNPIVCNLLSFVRQRLNHGCKPSLFRESNGKPMPTFCKARARRIHKKLMP